MADISSFPDITNVAYSVGPTMTFTSSGSTDIKPGMVVAIDATGVSMTVRAAIAESGEMPLGVALTNADVSESEAVTVMLGGIAYVANADDTTGIDAGSFLETNDNSVGGTITAVDTSATGGATVTVHNLVIGVALDDIAGGATGRMLILPGSTVTQANSS